MTPESTQYLNDTKEMAEALLKKIEEGKRTEGQLNHHTRNCVQMLRYLDPLIDSERDIRTVCDDTWKRLTPFLNLLKNE